jgi:hypothetical protein
MAVSSQVGGSSAVAKKCRLGVLFMHGIGKQQGSTRNGTVGGRSHKRLTMSVVRHITVRL